MATVATIRDALQTALDDIDGLRPYDVAIGHERMPCSIVFPTGVERVTAGGLNRYKFVVEVYVSLNQGLARAQDQLDSFIDPETSASVEAAIESDLTLGSVVHSVRVDGFTSYRFAELNGNTGKPNALMARIPLEVMA